MSPVSPKVIAASVTALVVTLLTTYVLKGHDPASVELVVAPLVTAVLTFAAGWWAKHR